MHKVLFLSSKTESFKKQKRDASYRVPTIFHDRLLLPGTRNTRAGSFGQLSGGSGAALRANGGGLRAARGGDGGAAHDVDESG